MVQCGGGSGGRQRSAGEALVLLPALEQSSRGGREHRVPARTRPPAGTALRPGLLAALQQPAGTATARGWGRRPRGHGDEDERWRWTCSVRFGSGEFRLGLGAYDLGLGIC